ncbi:MAG: hypothetical protein N3A66_07345, partial [Planctomycetota bacterium]|nr:hypothetical protein [Planctomycetota bacterium]
MRRLGLLFILLGGYRAAAAEDFSQGIIDRAAAIKAAAAITRAQYPDADDVLVDDHIRIEYEADGTFVSWDDTYLK